MEEAFLYCEDLPATGSKCPLFNNHEHLSSSASTALVSHWGYCIRYVNDWSILARLIEIHWHIHKHSLQVSALAAENDSNFLGAERLLSNPCVNSKTPQTSLHAGRVKKTELTTKLTLKTNGRTWTSTRVSMHTSLALSSTAKQLGNPLRDTWSLRTVVRALEDFTPLTHSLERKKRGPRSFLHDNRNPSLKTTTKSPKQYYTIACQAMSPDRFRAQRGLYACRQTFARDAQSLRILQFRLYSLHLHYRSLPSFLWGRRNRWRETERERERENWSAHLTRKAGIKGGKRPKLPVPCWHWQTLQPWPCTRFDPLLLSPGSSEASSETGDFPYHDER